MTPNQLHQAAKLQSNLETLNNLLDAIAKSSAGNLEIAVTEEDDGALLGDGDGVLIEVGALVEFLKGQRDAMVAELRGMGVEVG